MSFCTGLKNLHDDDEEVIIVVDIVDVVLLSPALRLKCKRMLIVACISYFSILCPTYCNTFVLWTNSEFIRRQEKIGANLKKERKLFVLLSLRKVRKIKKSS